VKVRNNGFSQCRVSYGKWDRRTWNRVCCRMRRHSRLRLGSTMRPAPLVNALLRS
jgi:hypothetical protein